MTHSALDTPQAPVAERSPGAAPARPVASLWLASLATATLGTATIWMAMPGLNWPLWTVAVSLAFLAHARRSGKTLGAPVLLPVVLACLISLGAAVTADEPWLVFTVMIVAALLASATLLVSGQNAARIGAFWILFAPPVAALQVFIEAMKRLGESAGLLRAERSGPVLRGLAIALPVVLIFGLLLADVDPTLGRWRDAVANLLDTMEWIPRLIFFLGLGGLSLGALGIALRPAVRELVVPERAPAFRIGATERTILFGSVAGLFALFLVLQVSYLFGNAPAVVGSGVTFAEYARRGFGELTIVATLCTLLVLLTDRHADRGAGEERVRVLQLVLVGELQLLLASAFRRVMLYESAYGFTSARLYAQAYMIVVSILLVMLASEIWTGLDGKRLVRRAALVGTGVFAVLTAWNHDAWIARQNIERYRATGKLDVHYLVRELSPNALPTVIALLPALPTSDAAAVSHCIQERYARGRMWTTPERWYEWNLRRAAARQALASAGFDLATPPPADGGYSCQALGEPRVMPRPPATPAVVPAPAAAPTPDSARRQ